MADRYWVGGTATWNSTAGTKWALTSGGAGGQPVPTAADDVYFTAASGTVTVSIASTNNGAKSINCTGFTGTLASTGAITVYGSVTLVPGMGFTYTGTITLGAAGTLTTAGKTLRAVTVNAVGGTVTLGDALTSISPLTITTGTFTTNNFNVTVTTLVSNNSNTRTINLGSSTVTLSATNDTVNFSDTTGLTFNAGTSTIVLTSTSGPGLRVGDTGSGLTFYDVSFTGANGSATLRGQNTFRNVSVAGRTTTGIKRFSILADQTINGTLTISAGTDATMRTVVLPVDVGVTRTLTCAAVASLTDIDFRDITIAGAAAPVSGTRLGDCKGNSGITFDAPKTVYWNLPAGANWSSLAWATSSGGSPAVGNFPLAQDTCIFDKPGLSGSSTVTIESAWNIGTIDMSARSTSDATTMALACSASPVVFGNWINGDGISITGTGRIAFAGQGSQTITSAGRPFSQSFDINSFGGSVTLLDAFRTTASDVFAFVLNAGTFDISSYTATLSGTLSGFSANFTSVAKTFSSGVGTFVIAGSGGWAAGSSPSFTVTGTGTISLTGLSTKTFAGGGIQTYPTLDQGGQGQINVTGSNKFANITNTRGAVGATSVSFAVGTTNEFDSFNLSGQSGRICTLRSSTFGLQANLKKADAWLMGANSTDGGSNTGLLFIDGGGIDYLLVESIRGLTNSILASIAESATATDTQRRAATLNTSTTESAAASDIQAAGLTYTCALAESATVVDAVEAFRAYLASVAESSTTSDIPSALRTLSATIAELTTGSEQATAKAVLSASASELATAADSLFGGLLFLSSLSETATAQDIASSALIFNRMVSEATTAADVVAAAAAFSAVVPEFVTSADVASALATLGGSVSEALTALDTLRRSKVQAVNLADYTETGAGVSFNVPEVQLIGGERTTTLVSYNEIFAEFLGIHYETTQVELLNNNRTTALVSYNEIFAEVLSVPTSVKRS